MSIYFWFQFALLIAFLFIAAPRGGMFLGLFSGIGLIVIMFGPKPWLGLPPGKPAGRRYSDHHRRGGSRFYTAGFRRLGLHASDR